VKPMWSKGHRLHPRGGAAPVRWRPTPATATPGRARTDTPLLATLLGEDATVDNQLGADPEGPSLEAQLAEAYQQGTAHGRESAERLMADERARLVSTVQDIAGLRRRVLEAAEHDVMQLAVGMARRVLHREVQLEPDILLSMAHVALRRMGDRPVATARLHPEDLAAITTQSAVVEGLTLMADPEIPRGGCRLVSSVGEVDLGVDAQMTELSRVLLGELSSVERVQLH
jgi:flagellar assembly protein FliH